MTLPASVSRRRFVQGLTAGGGLVLSAGALWPRRAFAATDLGHPMLSGTKFDIAVEPVAVNITGKPRMATMFNGVMPGPILRWREGDTLTLNVTNRLKVPTSVHWHGILLPNAMDGVPGLTYRGIMPGETFTYRFPVIQSGTYWYHSHTGGQEQTGLQGPILIEPKGTDPVQFDREYVVMLTDWTDESPDQIIANLKQNSDYYNYQQRTLGTFLADAERHGLAATFDDRTRWGAMRMSPTDIMDVTAATYTFLVNGHPPAANWTALFAPGERVRLRFINGSAMTTFDVRIPGLELTIVQADGSDVMPVTVDEFRIAVAETYDVIVQPKTDAAYTIFAQAEDRSGYARGTLAPRAGMVAAVPPMDPPVLRSMADMGMGDMNMGGMDMAKPATTPMDMGKMEMPKMDMPGMADNSMKMGDMKMADQPIPTVNGSGADAAEIAGSAWVTNVAMAPRSRLNQAGDGLDGNGRRNLTYADLMNLEPGENSTPPTRAIEFHLTGNMERFVWGFDGKTFSQAPPVKVKLNERVRFVLINDTMMEHPIHLHGYLFELENGHGGRLPFKHTVNVKPAERVSFVFTANAPGYWAFHCHLLYHMATGMFRTVFVS